MQCSLPSLGCLILASTCLAQTPNWIQVKTQTTPPGRWSHGMAYDFIRGRTIVFGGTGAASNYMNDTWVYDGKDWAQMQPKTVPPGRRLVGMAFHFARVKTLMFGGLAATGVLNDTWEWNGTDWTQLNPQNSPGGRRSAAMAYDFARQRTVLFGGHTGSAYVNDTWEWDGVNWTQITTKNAPSGRYTNMVYDSARKRIVIHSGYPGYPADTWEYDGNDWTQVNTPTTPAGRCCAGVAYDSARQRVVIVAGLLKNAPRQASDTWEYPGTSLTGSPASISIASGGTHAFSLDAGAQHGNRSYWIFGSLKGTSPGVTLVSAVGSVTIPLAPDFYTDLTISLANTAPWVNTRGTLDAAGKNTQARFVVPTITDQRVIGLTFYHAYLVYDLTNNFYMASNPVTLQLVK
jgi:hypothetical protein